MTQWSLLKCLLAYIVSIVYNFMDAEVRVIRRDGTLAELTLNNSLASKEKPRVSGTGSPMRVDTSLGTAGSTWSASSQSRLHLNDERGQSGVVGSVPLLETGGLNWFVGEMTSL